MEMGAPEIETFLTYLAVERRVASSTQNQALSAILFLYKEVLDVELPWLKNVKRARKSEKLPVVFSKEEMSAVVTGLDGRYWIMAQLLYGAGLRLMECIRLRVKDIDFHYKQVCVRDGKGKIDRITMLPNVVQDPMRQHLEKSKILHQRELSEGYGEVYVRSGKKISESEPGMGVAICFFICETIGRSAFG